MTKKRTLAAILSASVLTAAAGIPAVYANEDNHASMEQRAQQAQSAVNDAWIDGKLETTLLFNEHLNSFDIDTDVKNGVAYLNGTVESDIDRDLAGEIAESIDGVRDVENRLVVDAENAEMAHGSDDYEARRGFKQSVMNATLTARVKSQLLVNSNTGGLSIDVDSRDGIVTLSGEVDSSQEKDLAVQIARNTEGARSVNDNLMVGEQQEEAE